MVDSIADLIDELEYRQTVPPRTAINFKDWGLQGSVQRRPARVLNAEGVEHPRHSSTIVTSSNTRTGDPLMSAEPMTNADQPIDELAGKLKRTELQHTASSIPGRRSCRY